MGLRGIDFSVFGPTFTKKSFIVSTISLGLLISISLTFNRLIHLNLDLFKLIIDVIPSHIFLLFVLFSSKY